MPALIHPLHIRAARPADTRAIDAVLDSAFGRREETETVTRLLDANVIPRVSLVAVEGHSIVGYALFTPVTVEQTPPAHLCFGLAPLAVVPNRQGLGIGTRLATTGLDRCQAIGGKAVFVLGHATYYPRFGFEPAVLHGMDLGDPRLAAFFFARALEPGGLSGLRGRVRFHPLFDAL